MLLKQLLALTLFAALAVMPPCVLRAQWVHTGPAEGSVTSFATVGSNVFVSTHGGGIFRSTDTGLTWVQINLGLTDTNINLITAIGQTLFVAGDSVGDSIDVFRSDDLGSNWHRVPGWYYKKSKATVFYSFGGMLYAGTQSAGIFRSSDGYNWNAKNTGFSDSMITSIVAKGSYLFAGTEYHGVFRSGDSGNSWLPVSQGLPSAAVLSLAVRDSGIFALSANSIYFSSNYGRDWSRDTVTSDNLFGFSYFWPYKGKPNASSSALADFGAIVLAGSNQGVYRSSDSGTTWTLSNNGMYLFGVSLFQTVNLITDIGSGIIARTDSGKLYFTSDVGTHWNYYSGFGGNTVNASLVTGSNVFVATDTGGVLRSTDNGNTWTTLLNMTNSYPVTSLAAIGSDIFAGTLGSGIFLTTDDGNNWIAVNHGLPAMYVHSLLGTNTAIFAGTDSGVFRSTNHGGDWLNPDTGHTGPHAYGGLVILLDSVGDYIFAGTNNWGGPYRSSNGGASWLSGGEHPHAISLAAGGGNLFEAGDTADWSVGIKRTTDNGQTWIKADSGIPGLYGYPYKIPLAVAVIGGLVYAGFVQDGLVGGVWRRPLSDFPVGPPASIQQSDLQQGDLLLSPNPTDGLITITAMSKVSHISVMNLIGQSVIEISNPNKQEIVLDLSKLPASAYFARFSIGDEITMRKIVKE